MRRRTNNNRATIPSLNRITNHPRHYHSHINADQQISINMVYDVNRQLPTNAVPQLNNNNIQNILSTPPLFDSVKCQTRLISTYIIEKQIGQGGYGKVYKGIDKNNNRVVAIKQMDKRKERNGFSQNALREIKLLREIYHTNSVTLLQIVVGDDKNNLDDIRKNPMYLIYEYIDHDLAGVLKRKKKLSQDLVRCYTYQLLQVLAYLHSIHIMHRDLKLSNILVTNNNKIKLCDFGLARKESILLKENERRYTNNVITLWYRPPELLFGATNYDTSVDMWSVGCILGELLLGKVLFKGTTHLKSDKKNVDQIRTKSSQTMKIWNVTGSPTLKGWPEHDKLPEYKDIATATKLKSHGMIKRTMDDKWENAMSYDAYDAVQRMLVLDPLKRLSAKQAKKASFFNPRRGGFDEKLLHPETFPKLFQEGSSNHEWEIRHGKNDAVPGAGAVAANNNVVKHNSNNNNNNTTNNMMSNSNNNARNGRNVDGVGGGGRMYNNNNNNNNNNRQQPRPPPPPQQGYYGGRCPPAPPMQSQQQGPYRGGRGDNIDFPKKAPPSGTEATLSRAGGNNGDDYRSNDNNNNNNINRRRNNNNYISNRGPPNGPPPPIRNQAPPPRRNQAPPPRRNQAPPPPPPPSGNNNNNRNVNNNNNGGGGGSKRWREPGEVVEDNNNDNRGDDRYSDNRRNGRDTRRDFRGGSGRRSRGGGGGRRRRNNNNRDRRNGNNNNNNNNNNKRKRRWAGD